MSTAEWVLVKQIMGVGHVETLLPRYGVSPSVSGASRVWFPHQPEMYRTEGDGRPVGSDVWQGHPTWYATSEPATDDRYLGVEADLRERLFVGRRVLVADSVTEPGIGVVTALLPDDDLFAVALDGGLTVHATRVLPVDVASFRKDLDDARAEGVDLLGYLDDRVKALAERDRRASLDTAAAISAARAESEAALMQFKERVTEKALEIASAQGWCDEGVEEALGDLGIDIPEREVSARLTLTVYVTGTYTSLRDHDNEIDWDVDTIEVRADNVDDVDVTDVVIENIRVG